jgi:hypothetical protein
MKMPAPSRTNTNYTSFAAMTPDQQQAYCDFKYWLLIEAIKIVRGIERDLADMKDTYGFKPRPVYLESNLLRRREGIVDKIKKADNEVGTDKKGRVKAL